MTSAARLYTPELLALATSLARWPLADNLTQRGSARSPTCGSSLELGLALGPAGRIARIGLLARACAVGQAAAAVFAEGAPGKTLAEVEAALVAIDRWLAGGDAPDWPGISALSAAREVPGRHGAIRLSWQAACVALSTPAAAR